MLYVRQTDLVDGGQALEETGLVHRVRQPMMAGPHPTIVMLHGLGGSEESTWLLGPSLPRDWLVVAPRGIEQATETGYAWRSRGPDEWPGLPDFDPAVAAVSRFITGLPGLYGADPDMLFLMGFSQGAATAFATAIAHPARVRGIAAVVGFIPTDCAAAEVAPLAGLPVFMAVGKGDPLIPYERSKACAEMLQVVGTDLEYHEYDVGHKMSSQGMRDLRAWWDARAPRT